MTARLQAAKAKMLLQASEATALRKWEAIVNNRSFHKDKNAASLSSYTDTGHRPTTAFGQSAVYFKCLGVDHMMISRLIRSMASIERSHAEVYQFRRAKLACPL